MFPRDEKEGEIPRQNSCYHSDGFAKKENVLVWAVAGNKFAFNAPGPLGHIFQIAGTELDFDLRERQDLALFFQDCGGDPIRTIAEAVSDLSQITRAVVAGKAAPAVLRIFCCVDRLGDLGFAAIRHSGSHPARGRIVAGIKVVAGLGFEPRTFRL